MVQVIFPSGPGGVTPQPPHPKGWAGVSGSGTTPREPFSGVSGVSGYSVQFDETLDPGELLEALQRNTAIMMKIASLVDACIRRLSPEARADAFQEAREGTP